MMSWPTHTYVDTWILVLHPIDLGRSDELGFWGKLENIALFKILKYFCQISQNGLAFLFCGKLEKTVYPSFPRSMFTLSCYRGIVIAGNMSITRHFQATALYVLSVISTLSVFFYICPTPTVCMWLLPEKQCQTIGL